MRDFRIPPRHFSQLMIALMVSVWCVCPVRGETKIVKLPFESPDFALNPESGDLVALDNTRKRAVLFRSADLEMNKVDQPIEVPVASAASAVCFKRFGKTRLFIIGCAQDSNLAVIDAVTFELKKRISIPHGAMNVMASLNENDPFVYYHFHETLSAVDLRTFADRGVILDGISDGAISADGLTAYRRRMASPTGFESLICTSGLNVDKPVFVRRFHRHESTSAYFPDPHSRYTGTNTNLYSRYLDRRVATFDFLPRAFSATRPFVFGMRASESYELSRNVSGSVTLSAASYNTMSKVGKTVVLSPATNKDERAGRRMAPWQVSYKPDFLTIDDPRSILVFARRAEVFLVPLDDFELPTESLLMADLIGPVDLLVGQTSTFELKASDPRISVQPELLPDGAVFEKGKLTWTPAPDQVGETEIEFGLKDGDLASKVSFVKRVAYPALKLPFEPNHIVGNDQSGRILLWSVPRNSSFPQRTSVPENESSQLALIDWTNQKLLATTTVNRSIRSAALTEDAVFLLFADDPSSLDVLEPTQLKRIKTLGSSGRIDRIRVSDGVVSVTTDQLVETFDRTTWKRKSQFAPTNPSVNYHGGDLSESENGIVVEGVLRNFQGQPLLIAAPYNLPFAGSFDQDAFTVLFDETKRLTRLSRPNPGGIAIPGTNSTASAIVSGQPINVPDAVHTWQTLTKLELQIKGEETKRILLEKKLNYFQVNSGSSYNPPSPMVVGSGKVAINHADRLYFWQQTPAGPPMLPPLEWTTKQSAFILTSDSPTVLTHAVRGGKGPYQYTLLTSMDGLELDEKSGDVKVSSENLNKWLVSQLALPTPFFHRVRDLLVDANRLQLIKELQLRLKVQLKGLPVAVPVRMKVIDAEERSLTLQYLVLADLPLDAARTRMQQLTQSPDGQSLGLNAPGMIRDRIAKLQNSTELLQELERVNKRIDALETRIDLLIKVLSKQDSVKQEPEKQEDKRPKP